MPLFGHKDKNVDHNVNNNTTTGRNDFPNNSAGVAGVGAGQRHHDRHNAGHDTQGGMNPQQQGFGGTGAQGAQGGYTQGADPYSNTAGYNDPSIPPANQINTGQHGGGGARMAGKKEQEAESYKQQSAEIGEAERLEKEALLRRERAVQHGADPRNKALGGGAQGQNFGNNFDNNATGGTGPTGGQGLAGQRAL
ncbi:unnamed protein product [Somion occarium]|uniref:Uncharacterized protein n=1 Tax=Somion occarium TaxID=3059160 RepID=A0ABP1CUU3_9APHY